MDWIKTTTRLLEIIVITLMATMTCLVFLNVILRYGFSSGAAITEELSRYLFVWLTFIGAILTFKENQHVSVQVLVEKLSPARQRILRIVTDALMLYCCYLLLVGSWQQAALNMHNALPISGLPTGLLYSAGVVTSLGIGLILALRLLANLFRRGDTA